MRKTIDADLIRNLLDVVWRRNYNVGRRKKQEKREKRRKSEFK